MLFEVLTPGLMLEQMPGVFCAGEMLDWEAPTGGYLLQASFASGRQAGVGAVGICGADALLVGCNAAKAVGRKAPPFG